MQKSVDSFRNGKYNKHIKFPQRKDLEENNMDVKKIKEEFIEYFGEEKWNQEKVLADVRQVVFDVCERWLSIKPVPVLFNKDIGTDEARLDVKERVIWLNPKNQNKWIELLDSTIHELEHLYQILYVASNDTPKARRWKKELANYIGGEDPLGNLMQEIELDARAFSQVVLATDYGISYKHEDPIIQLLIEHYIKSGKMLSED